MGHALLLVAFVVVVAIATSSGVVRCHAVTGDGSYYTEQTAAEQQALYLSREGLGIWYGPGCDGLGFLSGGELFPEPFKDLLRGYGPGGKPLVQNAGSEKRQPGTEFNFSTSKYFDVLYALANDTERERLKALFVAEIKVLLDVVAREHSFTRRGHGGKKTPERCDPVFAIFIHESNRSGDPFLHGHVVCPNLCVRRDGTTGTIESKPFFEAQRLLSVLFDMRIASRLYTDYGIKVVRDRFSFSIPHVPESLVKRWSSRSRQIGEKLGSEQRTPDKARKAARDTRPKKRDWDPGERRATYEREAAPYGIDIGVALRRGQNIPVITPDADAHLARVLVSRTAESLTVEAGSFTRSQLIIKAALGSFGQGVTADAILSAIDRAISQPVAHNMCAAGKRDGESTYRFTGPVRATPTVQVPGQAAPVPAPSTVPQVKPNNASQVVPVTARPPQPGPASAPVPSRITPPREPAPKPVPTPNPASPRSPIGTAPGPRAVPQEVGMLRSAAATITATVRAWLAVRASAAYLVSVAGHFTRNELVKTAVTRSQRDPIPLTVLKAAADKFLDRPLLNRLVEVGTRGKEEVWTARGHERAERKFLRDSAALARSRGRGLKSSAVHEAARHLNKHGEQLVTAFRGVTHRRSQLGLLSTPSGEDKTRVLNAVCEAYERSGFRVRLTAPTGVAVDSLKNETKRPAKTTAWLLADVSRMPIIKVLGWMHKQSAFNLPAKLKGAETVRRPFDPLTKKDVVVLDSAHLLGTREGQRLAASCRKAGAKLILVGDHFRSAGVVAGGGWRELTARHRAFAIPVPKPQAESPERKAAYEVRAGNPYKAAETLRGAGRVHSGRGSVTALLKRYRDNDGLIEPARHLIVVGRDREAAAINKTVQRERRDAGLLGLASVRVGAEKRTSVRAGDRVMFTRSSVTLGVQTGRTGTVISVNPLLKTVTVRQDRGGDLTVRTSTFPHLALAYAANIRRSPSIAVANYYALVAGRGYSGPSMVTLLEQASERVQFFLAARHASLARILSQADPKKLATTHRPGQDRPLQEQQSTQSQSQNVSP